MVNLALWSMTVAIASGDDSTSLLQVFAGVRLQSQGQHILAAAAKEGGSICVDAAAGDVAPLAGSFIPKMGQQAIVVAAGTVAEQAGSFCVPKQDVLLMQRTFGLNTARDFEAALASKKDDEVEATVETAVGTKATCASYRCMPTWVKQIGVDNKQKPTEHSCCEPTCAWYTCQTRNWVKQIGVDDKAKPTDKTCCEPTCANYQCRSRDWVKQIGVDDKTKPSDKSCCEPTCASYHCSSRGWIKKCCRDDETSPTDQICCEPTCASYHCTTRNWVKQIGVDGKTRPSEKSCCEPTCANYQCRSRDWVKQIGVDDKTSPTDQSCCEPTCASFPCTTRNWVKQMGSDNKTKPTDESCCEPSCATVVCEPGLVTRIPWLVPATPSNCCEASLYTASRQLTPSTSAKLPQPIVTSMPTNGTFGQCAESCFEDDSCFRFAYGKANGVAECFSHPREPGKQQYEEVGRTDVEGIDIYKPQKSCPNFDCPDGSICQSGVCLETCATYSCPTNFVNNSENLKYPVDNIVALVGEEYVVDPSLDLEKCCKATCAVFSCPQHYETKNSLSTDFTQSNCCQLSICWLQHLGKFMPGPEYDLLAQPLNNTWEQCKKECLQDPRCIAFSRNRYGGELDKCWLKNSWTHADEHDESIDSYQLRGCDLSDAGSVGQR